LDTRVLLISHLHPIQDKLVLIRLGYSMAPLEDRMLRFFFLLLVVTPIGLILAGFAGHRIAKRALLPLDLMAARAESITASNLNDRIVVEHPHDGLGHMAKVLNHLLERLEQAFVQLQRFTADAAHELRTPLSSLRATGEVALQESRNESGYRESIGSMLEETTRLNQTIDGLLLLARAETTRSDGTNTSFSLIELIDEILALLEVLLESGTLLYGTTVMTVGPRFCLQIAVWSVWRF
jgi:signal transduction histidine kinase